MDSLRKYLKYILILLFGSLLNACTNIYWGIIKNSTDEVIQVKLTFINEYGTQVLELMPIESNDSSVWEYRQSSLVITKIDEDLSMVEATNAKGCTIMLDREEIEKNVSEHKQQIIISTDYFFNACTK